MSLSTLLKITRTRAYLGKKEVAPGTPGAHPDGNATERELHELVTFACELRQRVHQQLCAIAPGEFKPKLIAPAQLASHSAPTCRRVASPDKDRLNTDAVVGAATGLAVLTSGEQEYGGDVILVQVSAINGPPGGGDRHSRRCGTRFAPSTTSPARTSARSASRSSG
jgi:hypothetical protein